MTRNSSLLAVSTLLAGMASGIAFIALSWLLHTKYMSFSAQWMLNIFGMMLGLVILPSYSKWIDRSSPILIAKITLLIVFVLKLLVCSLISIYGESIIMLTATGIISTCFVMLEPVFRVSLAKLVIQSNDYGRVSRLFEVMQQLSTFLAGIVAALVLGWCSIKIILYIEVFLVLIAAVSISLIKLEPDRAFLANMQVEKCNQQKESSLLSDNAIFYSYILLTYVPFICIMAERVILPGLFHDILKVNPNMFSLQTLPYMLGAMLAVFLSGYVDRYMQTNMAFFCFVALHALFMWLMLVVPSLLSVFLALFAFALSHCSIRICRTAWVLHNVSQDMIGRINGNLQVWVTVMILLLGSVLAYSASLFGVMLAWWVLCIFAAMPVILMIALLVDYKKILLSPVFISQSHRG